MSSFALNLITRVLQLRDFIPERILRFALNLITRVLQLA